MFLNLKSQTRTLTWLRSAAGPVLYPHCSRILLLRAAWERGGRREESGAKRAGVLPRKFSSHDEVNQIAIAAIAQLPECGARGRGRSGSCVMVISTGPNEGGSEGGRAKRERLERERSARRGSMGILNVNRVATPSFLGSRQHWKEWTVGTAITTSITPPPPSPGLLVTAFKHGSGRVEVEGAPRLVACPPLHSTPRLSRLPPISASSILAEDGKEA